MEASRTSLRAEFEWVGFCLTPLALNFSSKVVVILFLGVSGAMMELRTITGTPPHSNPMKVVPEAGSRLMPAFPGRLMNPYRPRSWAVVISP